MIEYIRINKSYGETKAISDLTLTVKSGEVFGLLGPNGAGKTTAVGITVGLIAPDEGAVVINEDYNPINPRCRGQLGLAPQEIALYDELTGRENLSFFGKLQHLAGAKLKDRVKYVLDFVNLSDRMNDLVKTYSGGMKRRLNIAASLIHDPQILLLDEPTAGVDPQSRNAIFENIKALQSEGKTIIYTTHYMEEAEKLCDRVGIIDRGSLMALDTVDGLINKYGGKSILVLEINNEEEKIETDSPLDEIRNIKNQEEVTSFRVDRPNLEQVFLNLTGRTLRD